MRVECGLSSSYTIMRTIFVVETVLKESYISREKIRYKFAALTAVKLWYFSIKLHGVTSQKTEVFIFTVARTSDMTKECKLFPLNRCFSSCLVPYWRGKLTFPFVRKVTDPLLV